MGFPTMRKDQLEHDIAELLADSQYENHPLREALAALDERYRDHIAQIERLTSIADGFQMVARQKDQSVAERYRKQIRQMQKIARIADHYQGMLRSSNELLKAASTHDHLTGLPNRRLMIERLTSEESSVDRRRPPFSLALIDIDHFKSINDDFGHDAGDKLLIRISSVLSESLRDSDLCARWGGEEFLILLPETSGEGAHVIADRLRLQIATLKTEDIPDTVQTTVSIGLAEHRAATSYTETIKRADKALYEAKRGGRNRIALAE